MLEYCILKGCGISVLGGIQNSAEQDPDQLDVCQLCLEQEVGQ